MLTTVLGGAVLPEARTSFVFATSVVVPAFANFNPFKHRVVSANGWLVSTYGEQGMKDQVGVGYILSSEATHITVKRE